MPVPQAAWAATRIVASRRGRRLLLALLAGLAAGLGTIVVVLISSVGAVAEGCQREATEATPQAASPGATPSPSYVSQEPSKAAVSDIPADFLALYREAARDYGLDWAILAAIGKIETDHARLEAPGVLSGENSSGAGGPMQFLAGTWASAGVDGNGDGVKDRYDPEDAIPGAANYLKLSGAPEDYYSAIFSYNRADWYVRDVLAQADEYRAAAGEEDGGGGGSEVASSVLDAASGTAASLLSPFATREARAQEAVSSGAAFPLPDGTYDYDDTWGASRGAGRTHEGTDVFAPEGTTLHSVTDGTVVQVSGADSQGWNYLGGWTVMIEASESVGPVQAGDTLYYAHMREPSTLPVGTTVRAGDPIGHVGSTGEGPPGTLLQPASRGQHLHLGWYDPTGERAEAASGAMNPYPLLQWLEGSDGKVEAGEVVPGSSSSLAQPVALGPPGSSDPLPAYCLPLRTFGLLPSSPQPATGPTEAGDPSSAPALGSGEAEDLLSNPNFVPSEAAEGDLRAGIVDARLVSLLQAITEKHMIEVSVFKTGHPYGPYLEEIGLADVPNSHWSGKTADITDIDGKPVMGNGTDPDVLDVGRMVFALPLGSRPDEVTGPTAWVAELGYDREDGMITDYEFTSAHEDHLHVGWGP